MRSKANRSPRRAGTAGALLRATLLVGPLAAAIAFGIAPRAGERLVAANGAEGIDTMTTGSVSPSRFTFALGASPVGGCQRPADGPLGGICR
ncbi:hypothetical protein [Aureimonas sp. SK2]|uniref:hypothetical protein n=1 Tax=Aureimonas sp. SK2 TaxID=3015992 RepID=UPI00244525B8|nr:hypothetical protein [Aureimonas sp. SK2]